MSFGAIPSVNPISRDSDSAIELAASQWLGRHDAGMTLSEKLEFERWMAADPRHTRAYARHEQTWKSFDRPMAAGQAEAMIEALAASKAWRRRRKARRLVTGFAACVFAGLLWHQTGGRIRRDAPGVVLASNAVVTLPEKRTLPDGSIVELKPGSVIEVHFGTNARGVTLERGEAFFQVAKNTRPFVVSAKGVGVRAVGTAFSVQLGIQAVEVLVTEGTVEVGRGAEDAETRRRGEAGDAETPETSDLSASSRFRVSASSPAHSVNPSLPPPLTSLLVGAGNRVLINLGPKAPPLAAITRVTPPDVAERLAWRKTRLDFTDTPLAVAADLFNRHSASGAAYRLMIDPKDVTLARMEVSGYFDADNVDAFVHLIEQTLGIKAERQSGQIILRRMR